LEKGKRALIGRKKDDSTGKKKREGSVRKKKSNCKTRHLRVYTSSCEGKGSGEKRASTVPPKQKKRHETAVRGKGKTPRLGGGDECHRQGGKILGAKREKKRK